MKLTPAEFDRMLKAGATSYGVVGMMIGKPVAKVKQHVSPDTGMNKLEEKLAAVLELRKRTGVIIDWKFGAMKFGLAKRTWYTPDFVVWDCEACLQVYEVKGFWRDDARVKIKVAARLFPLISFYAMTWDRTGKRWNEEHISP